MNRQLAFLACAAVALAAAGCGGAGSQMTPAGQSATGGQSTTGGGARTGEGTFRIVIPPKSSGTTSAARSPEYVSADTGSVAFTIGTGTPQVVALGPDTSGCTTQSGGGYVCTADFQAPIGDDALTVKTFQSTDGSGTALSELSTTITVTSNTADNAQTFTLDGVASALALTLDPTSVTTGTSSTVTASWVAKDAAGDTIIGPGSLVTASGSALATPTLSSSASSGITIGTYAPVNDTDGNSVSGSWPVSYDGSSITSPVTFTVSSGSLNDAAQLTVNGAPTPPPGISNGDFSSGSLVDSNGFGWTACSFQHATLTAPVNASPEPKSTPAQTTATTPLASPLVSVTAPPPNANPDVTATAPPLGSYVALTGDPADEAAGASGICQTFMVPSDATQLTFWVYEGGGEYNFKYADQEADLLTSGGAVQQTLFAELSCFQDTTLFPTETPATSSGCWPSAFGGDSNGYDDWQGGYWVQRGPYDLSTYAGQSVTLFIGVWSDEADTTGKYGNMMYVGNVQLSAAASGSVNVSGRSRR